MGGIVAGLAFKALGFGKILLGWIWDAVKGVFKFAIEKPFQFLTIALAIALLIAGCWGLSTKKELVKTQNVVSEKTKYIREQQKVLVKYVKALEVEKTNHVKDIRRSNDAVASIKRTADKAQASAAAAGRAIAKKQAAYTDMAQKYQEANVTTGTAEQRIEREQQTTDSFIDDWKKAK